MIARIARDFRQVRLVVRAERAVFEDKIKRETLGVIEDLLACVVREHCAEVLADYGVNHAHMYVILPLAQVVRVVTALTCARVCDQQPQHTSTLVLARC
jgi:hypothetical protein